jgi:hypothetical protein
MLQLSTVTEEEAEAALNCKSSLPKVTELMSDKVWITLNPDSATPGPAPIGKRSSSYPLKDLGIWGGEVTWDQSFRSDQSRLTSDTTFPKAPWWC